MRSSVRLHRLLIFCLPLLPQAARGAPLRAAVAPVERVNVSEQEGARLQRLLLQVLRDARGVAAARPLPALACDPREPECLERLGHEPGAERLLQLRLGRLGDTTVIRLTVYDLRRRARQGSWQEVLRQAAGAQAERQALERMVAGFAPPPPPPPAKKPWYTRWWVWTAAGAVIAGGVTAAVLATWDRGTRPDDTITPPTP
jgi:hypothetical protein